MAAALRVLLTRRNRKRDEAEAALGSGTRREGGNGDDQGAVDEVANDLTDFEVCASSLTLLLLGV